MFQRRSLCWLLGSSWLGIGLPTVALAQAPAPAAATQGPAAYVVTYDLRDFVGKPEVVKYLRQLQPHSSAEAGTADARTRNAGWVIGAIEAAVGQGKSEKANLDIELLNRTQLVIRATAARHAEIAATLNGLRGRGDVAVIVKTRLYEVDETAYDKLKKAKSIPSEVAERLFLEGKLPRNALFDLLEKQKPLATGEEIKVDSGRAAPLLSRHKAVFCLPSPDQLRQGDKTRQLIMAGVSFHGTLHVSPDRRYVRIDFAEHDTKLTGVQKVKARWTPAADKNAPEQQMDAEIPLTDKATYSRRLEIPDGGSILVPVHWQPPAPERGKECWVLIITPRIYIEEEERAIREGERREKTPQK
jgi:hypothetical protein